MAAARQGFGSTAARQLTQDSDRDGQVPVMWWGVNIATAVAAAAVLAQVWAAGGAVVAGHVATAVGEWVVHRFVYHGHARWVSEGRPTVFGVRHVHAWLHAGYVHHWLVHHAHAREQPDALAATGTPTPVQRQHADNTHGATHAAALYWSSYGMGCHGWGIVAHTATLLVTPMPVAWLLWMAACGGGWRAAAAFWAPAAWYAMSSCGYHKYLHMRKGLRNAAAPWWCSWLVLSAEGQRLAADHHAHHFGRESDAKYNIVPLARWFVPF